MHIHQKLLVLSAVVLSATFLRAQTLTASAIDQAVGRSGQQAGAIYRVAFPRTDLHVRVGDIDIKPGLALGSWAAFSGSDDHAAVMGDLVLLEVELNPVIRKLRAAGFEISAIHNHLITESPHVMYVHYMGHGKAAEIARALHDALAESATPLGKPAAPAAGQQTPEFVSVVEQTMKAKGRFAGGVLAFGIPRAEPITEDGTTLTPAQGVAESINFQEAGTGRVATTGDFVLTADEVNPVLSALLDHNIAVTALHSHLLTEQPRLFFMHFWGLGTTESVAQGIRAALDKVHVQ